MVAHTDEELVFTPDGNRMWIAVTDKGKISVNVLKDVTKIFHTREERFDDLFEALQYIQNFIIYKIYYLVYNFKICPYRSWRYKYL